MAKRERLTPEARANRLLAFLATCQRSGQSVTIRMIEQHMGYRSRSGIVDCLDILENAGQIKRMKGGRACGIEVLQNGMDAVPDCLIDGMPAQFILPRYETAA